MLQNINLLLFKIVDKCKRGVVTYYSYLKCYRVKEKEQMIEEQLSELTSLKKEITRLKEDLESQREKNNVSIL